MNTNVHIEKYDGIIEVKLNKPKVNAIDTSMSKEIAAAFKELNENLILASRNIPNIEVIEIKSLNPISLLKHETILISEDCFKELEELYS